MTECELGQQYIGYIWRMDDRGVLVRFYNQMNGLISKRDIDDHEYQIEKFKIYRSQRVFIGGIDRENNKI